MSSARKLQIFVTNLKWTVSPGDLRSYFGKFGRVVDSRISFTKSGWSRGYGFVTFSNPRTYDAVLSHDEHTLDGEILSVSPSIYSQTTPKETESE